MIFHLLVSALLLISIRSFAFGPGPFGGCCVLSRAEGMLLAFFVVLSFALLLVFEVLRWKRRSGLQKRSGCCRVLGGVAAGVLDVALLANAIFLFVYCLMNDGRREFWGEGKSVEIGDLTIPPATCALDIMAKVYRDGERKVPGFDTPELTSLPHFCIGAANLGEPGFLKVRLVDLTNGTILGESDKVAARWSNDQTERFTYVVRCPFFCGRRSKYYRVKCEVWGIPDGTGVGRLIESKDIITNGAY